MSAPTSVERLYRSKSERMLFGVCGGFATYFDLDPTLVRLIFVLLTLATRHRINHLYCDGNNHSARSVRSNIGRVNDHRLIGHVPASAASMIRRPEVGKRLGMLPEVNK